MRRLRAIGISKAKQMVSLILNVNNLLAGNFYKQIEFCLTNTYLLGLKAASDTDNNNSLKGWYLT